MIDQILKTSFVTIKECMIISTFLCLVDVKGTLQRAIGETQSAFEQGTGREGTILLEECFVQKGIRMVDTRGFLENEEVHVDECQEGELSCIFGRYHTEVHANFINSPFFQHRRDSLDSTARCVCHILHFNHIIHLSKMLRFRLRLQVNRSDAVETMSHARSISFNRIY